MHNWELKKGLEPKPKIYTHPIFRWIYGCYGFQSSPAPVRASTIKPEMDFGFRTLDFFLLAKISAQNNLIRCTWKTMPPKRFRLQKKCMYIFRILFKLEPELSYICLFKSVDANSLFTEHINNFVSLSLSRPQEERGGEIYDKYQLKIS